jgi:hypothetical protein
MLMTTCADKRSPKCSGEFNGWGNDTLCYHCRRQKREDDIAAARARALARPYTLDVIHWSTLKADASKQEAWGNRVFKSVLISTRADKVDNALLGRLNEAIRARFPFNPTACTNQHSGLTCEPAGVPGKMWAKWETYHSIGD